jgi:hypothetical protein
MNDETLINPALVYKFAIEYGINLPDTIDDPERDELEKFYSDVEALTGSFQQNFHNLFRLERSVCIGIFSFAKIAMFRELTQLGVEGLMGHDTIAALVDSAHNYDPVDDGGSDRTLTLFCLREASLVVEADSGQRGGVPWHSPKPCHSGSARTGKSQTIVDLVLTPARDRQSCSWPRSVLLWMWFISVKKRSAWRTPRIIHPVRRRLEIAAV